MASNLGIFILVRNFANRQIRDSNFTNSNITILFSNSSPKIPKSGIHGDKFKDFLCLNKTLQ